ncbi:MAG: Protease II [uncultured Microvirga sp.]|uniref:Protease II n=1 Tax=uncultured Microvirga sp. TaxID=412392 RepID=A0A6J4MNM1_9HYPH|nr:MAG: Protease II [uncultured Microvirga sp.]
MQPHEFDVHGVRLRDDYAWLKAENWKEVLRDPSALPEPIRFHLERENAYGAAMLADTQGLREELSAEMRARIKEDDSSVPEPDGPFAYFKRFREGGQHPLIGRVPRQGGDEAILLDGDAESAGGPFFNLHDADPSPDHTRLAWGADTKGSELFAIRVRDLATGKDLADLVPGTSG